MLRAVLTAGLAAALVMAWAPPAGAEEASDTDTTVSWSVRPADTVQGSGRPNFAYDLPPGGTLTDGIIVTNRSDEPISLDIYAADGFLTPDGSLDILAGGEESTELGSWIEIESPQVSIASGESAEIPFEVVVPESTQPGDYAAGVVASMSVGSDGGVITERRLGSRVHLRVHGELAPTVTVTDVSLAYEGVVNPVAGGTAVVSFTLTNTGNARLAPVAAVQVAGPFGWVPTVAPGEEIPELLPGSSIEHVVHLDGVAPLGLITADVSVTADVVARAGGPAEEVPSATAAGSASTWAVPWSALALLLLIAAAIAWRVFARRRATAVHQRAVDEAVAAALAARQPAVDGSPDAGADAEELSRERVDAG
ncbi:DUF916 domain-containing protein [Agromyces sp. NPDC058484]|uniref:COG1470 family protein n=1 Tax=Agromyces sp. NPDC058484 TaxID=3346524 RepID=UPI0036615235